MNGQEKECSDLSYQETLRVIKERQGYNLKFHLSNQTNNEHFYGEKIEIDRDMPDSKGELEEEISGP